MCALGKTLFYKTYITGIAELPNINVPYTLRVSFTQTNYFVTGETKASVITIPLIYSTNIQAALRGSARWASFNKYKRCEIGDRNCLKALKPNTISVVFK